MDNREARPTGHFVISRNRFLKDPQGVINDVFTEMGPPSHISKWHSYYCTRVILAVSGLSLICFAFMKSQDVFLTLVYLLSGLCSLFIQSCFGLPGRLDRSCGDNKAHIWLIKLCYIVGFALWAIMPCYLVSGDPGLDRAKDEALSSKYSLLYFIIFVVASIAMGFLIILPASIVNEVVVVTRDMLCCGKKISYGVLDEENKSIEMPDRSSDTPPRLEHVSSSSANHLNDGENNKSRHIRL